MGTKTKQTKAERELAAHLENLAFSSREMESLWDERRAAAHLSVSPRCLQSWRLRAEGPPFLKLGSGRRARVRYRPADVRAWVDGHSHALPGQRAAQ